MGVVEELERIEKDILAEADLPLGGPNERLVFGKGNPKAKVLFVGEAPGKKESELGIPFVGAAGRELDKLLNKINLGIDDVYIANILKYRPPNNRDPNEEEMLRHTPYLVRQIKAINPRVICTLGNFSTKFVLAGFQVQGMKQQPGISQLHGKPREHTVEGLTFTLIPFYHPAAMLYKPPLRQVLENDIVIVAEHIGEIPKKKTLLDY